MRRGDVLDVEFDPVVGTEQGGRRPAVVVSRDSLNAETSRLIVVPITSARPGRVIFPNWVPVAAPEGGLTADSIVLCEQVRAVSVDRVFGRRGTMSAKTLTRIDRGLLLALGLDVQAPS